MLYAIHQNVKLEVIDAITVCLEGGGLEENRVKGLLYYVWEFFCSLNGGRGARGFAGESNSLKTPLFIFPQIGRIWE